MAGQFVFNRAFTRSSKQNLSDVDRAYNRELKIILDKRLKETEKIESDIRDILFEKTTLMGRIIKTTRDITAKASERLQPLQTIRRSITKKASERLQSARQSITKRARINLLRLQERTRTIMHTIRNKLGTNIVNIRGGKIRKSRKHNKYNKSRKTKKSRRIKKSRKY